MTVYYFKYLVKVRSCKGQFSPLNDEKTDDLWTCKCSMEVLVFMMYFYSHHPTAVADALQVFLLW